LGVGDPVSENRSEDESLFEIIEFFAAKSIEVPRNFFRSAGSEIRLVINKVIVEVGKFQECLYILDLFQLGPILNCLNLLEVMVSLEGNRIYLRYSTKSE